MKKSRNWVWVVMMMGLLGMNCDNTPTDQGPLWEKFWTVVYETQEGLGQIFFVSNDEAWIVSSPHNMLHYINGEFITVELPASIYAQGNYTITRCSFSDPDHGWAVGTNGNSSAVIYRYLYGNWIEQPPLPNSNYALLRCRDVVAVANEDVWVSGGQLDIGVGYAWHFNGLEWSRYELPEEGERMYFRSSNDGYLCKASTYLTQVILRWDGTSWGNPIYNSDALVYAIAFDANGRGFVTSYSGFGGSYGIYEIVGNHLEPREGTYLISYTDIASNSSGDIYTLGVGSDCHFIAHWNGDNWHYERTIGDIDYNGLVFLKEDGELWATLNTGINDYYPTFLVTKLNFLNP